MLESILLVLFLLIAVAIIGLVLVQNGKGADMGASFGAGASASLFGSSGTGNFLTRTTSILGLLFFILSIALANLSSAPSKGEFSDLEIHQSTPVQKQKPATTPRENNPTSDIPE